MADLSITITASDADVARMLAAFARRFRNPDLTEEEMLAGLKINAIQQIVNVVLAEEQAAIEEQKQAVVPLELI